MQDVKLTIRGKELLFGRSGFFEHIKDATKEDPLEWWDKAFTTPENGNPKEIKFTPEHVVVFAYAGLNTFLDVEEKENIGLEKVKKWVRTVDTADFDKIVNAAVACLTPTEILPAEEINTGEPQTQAVN